MSDGFVLLYLGESDSRESESVTPKLGHRRTGSDTRSINSVGSDSGKMGECVNGISSSFKVIIKTQYG